MAFTIGLAIRTGYSRMEFSYIFWGSLPDLNELSDDYSQCYEHIERYILHAEAGARKLPVETRISPNELIAPFGDSRSVKSSRPL